jgi:hypothetical protein
MNVSPEALLSKSWKCDSTIDEYERSRLMTFRVHRITYDSTAVS